MIVHVLHTFLSNTAGQIQSAQAAVNIAVAIKDYFTQRLNYERMKKISKWLPRRRQKNFVFLKKICVVDFAYSHHPISRCITVCVNVCSHVAKILKKITNMDTNIFSRIAQVLFFYYLTLTFIFKVKSFRSLLFCDYLTNGEKQSKHYCCHHIGCHVLAIEQSHCECCTS